MPSLDRAQIDADADRVVRRLARHGFKAYLVGGCVRDLLVGKKPKDFDVATSATPNEVKALFRNCRIIGRRFRLAHVFFGPKIIETSTFRANPREEEDEDSPDLLIRRDNVFGTETEDARRRDFTINGLFYDVEKEEVIDYVGGLDDLGRREVRTIGDPDIRFREDPVRILRAIKFAARLDFQIEPATYAALLRQRGEIRKCAPPRVVEEIYRLLRGGAARRSLELLAETGVLEILSSHLAALLDGPVHDEPADDDLGANGVDLDDEEIAWHRVWADDRPARARRIPVRLSFLSDPAELLRRRALAWATFDQLDRLVKSNAEVTNALTVATLLGPFLADTVTAPATRPGEANQAIIEIGQPLVDQLRVARRDAERTRYVLFGLRRVAAARARNLPIDASGGRDSLEEAVLLADLLAAARGSGAAAARGGGGEAEPDADEISDDSIDENGQRKRRRRRRGGRRRREGELTTVASPLP
ncbi:MAG TPA: polynucleotide adenylyltransferase PcnB [Kofleriaceae bacterium]|nr:polynucleotide adenylyltransferase PcnB [Kofleriaceae bacterium]